jgi:hypothetical protein
MTMGREGEVQGDLMMTWAEVPRSPGHVFYDRLQKFLSDADFDAFVEETCKPYYAPRMGAPSLPPGLRVEKTRNKKGRPRLPQRRSDATDWFLSGRILRMLDYIMRRLVFKEGREALQNRKFPITSATCKTDTILFGQFSRHLAAANEYEAAQPLLPVS